MNNIVCAQDLEDHAYKVLPKYVQDYYKSGASSEHTLKLNRAAFLDLRIRPKLLRDVSIRDLSTTIMGEKVSMPIGIAPTAVQKLAHPEGELATVKAAEEKGVIFILSTESTTSIEEIAKEAPRAIKWMQIHVLKDFKVTENLIRRAESSGFKAFVVTIDSPKFGLRLADTRNNFALPPHLRLANYSEEFVNETMKSVVYTKSSVYAVLTWSDLEFLLTLTKLPVLVKGVLTAEDAIKAVEIGVSGIIVSNHGGRQLDGVPATIEALSEVIKAVGDKIDVFVDGGFREGTDVFKALALGAKMVFVGRPVLWGLSYNGQQGVKMLLDILEDEFDNTLALTGCASVQDVSRDMVVHKSYYSSL